MIGFPKIDTLFDRGPDFTVDTKRVRRPEFAAVDRWIFTEKVDGTNIRVHFDTFDGEVVLPRIGGRTDRAQLPKPLQDRLEGRLDEWTQVASEIIESYGILSLTLFGEGYGPKIQKGGGHYRADQDFILFDVLVNDKTWLDEDAITETAAKFDVERVPTYAVGTTADGVALVTRGQYENAGPLRSLIAAEPEKFECEGIVARPLTPLYDGQGRRVMWKLKGSDFRAGKR